MDYYIFDGGRGRRWANTKHTYIHITLFKLGQNLQCFKKRKKKLLQAFKEEIKIVHSGTKERNILQAGELKFMQSF